ncbi:hypothetical protein KEM55_006783 [Ascosphaera atra]|nr:hypothetical protein KEM55_006783 [Ascosphaera atra]
MNNNTQPGAAPTTTSIADTPDATAAATTAPGTDFSTSSSSAPRKLAPPNSNCITCKVKHRKCDREKPVCKRCQHFNVPCELIDIT